ncbi:MAG: glycosyltransferase family 2 protein [Chitinophagaceae bacterium]|nr:MAG: glycosyltransferase family 2 protein [Chitinophagaceae bacterium]
MGLCVFIFWFSAIAAIYSYFIYPIILKFLVKFSARQPSDAEVFAASVEPLTMSLIVTAYNEQGRIREKIENSLALDFDAQRLEIIIASDCSEDDTDSIVKEYEERGVRLVRASERLGKENAQLAAINIARGDVLVFSDVATKIPLDALLSLEKYFSDPAIGAVSSEDRFISQDGSVAGEGAYVRYEMWLRKLESQLSGLIGLSGSFFAARKIVCQKWDIHCPSDFNTALNTIRHGMRSVSAPDVLGYYQDLKDSSKEYQRKVRTVIRGMTGLSRHKEVMDFRLFGVFAFQVISHKLMRWLAPWFFIMLFIASALLATHGLLYGLAFMGQLVFYGLAIGAHFLPQLRETAAIKIIYFFVQVNVALLDAAVKFLSGTRMTTWKPSAR